MQSPLPHVPEYTCYALARNMVAKLGARPDRVATEAFLSKHVTKPVSLQPYEMRMIARYYNKTFMVVPFGEQTKIALR